MDNEKFNIENTETIDEIVFDDKTNKLILFLFDGMDWEDNRKHMLLLQSKLNSYIRYIDMNQYLQLLFYSLKYVQELHKLYENFYISLPLLQVRYDY